MGKSCSKCGRPNHFAAVCRSDGKSKSARSKRQRGKRNVRKLDTDEESSTDDDSELSARIVVGKLSNNKKLLAKVGIQGLHNGGKPQNVDFITDTGISKTLINIEEWRKIKGQCELVKTSKRFRPYGTAYHLPMLGKTRVWLQTENGARTETWIYILRNKKEQNLLGAQTKKIVSKFASLWTVPM